MNYKEFKDYIEQTVPYETIYEDSEGRMILVVTMLAIYTAMNRKWVGLTKEEIDAADAQTWDEDHKSWGIHDFARHIEAKLKDKNNA